MGRGLIGSLSLWERVRVRGGFILTPMMERRSTMPEERVLGKNYPRVDAADKVSGRSQYAGDVHLPGMLICKVLKSSRPHARILRIDTSRAEQVPGVRAVITGQDIPDLRFGSGAVKDRRVFALEKVRFVGTPWPR